MKKAEGTENGRRKFILFLFFLAPGVSGGFFGLDLLPPRFSFLVGGDLAKSLTLR